MGLLMWFVDWGGEVLGDGGTGVWGVVCVVDGGKCRIFNAG